jgi:hypothetical protein
MNKRRKVQKPKADRSVLPITLPGSLRTDDLVSTSFRYVCGTSVTAGSVTRGKLLNLIGLASSSTNAYRIISGIRLRAVHIWTDSSPASGTVDTSTFEWTGGYTRPSVTTTSAMGTSGVTYQRHVPPKFSLAADWSISGVAESDVLFAYNVTVGDVVQLDVTYQLQNAVTGNYIEQTITTVSMAAGYIYSYSLDGGAKLVSVGRLATT